MFRVILYKVTNYRSLFMYCLLRILGLNLYDLILRISHRGFGTIFISVLSVALKTCYKIFFFSSTPL